MSARAPWSERLACAFVGLCGLAMFGAGLHLLGENLLGSMLCFWIAWECFKALRP